MRSVLMLVSVVAVAMLSGCAPKVKSKTAPDPITITQPDANTKRACFVTGETMTCLTRSLLPGGVRKVEITTTPLTKE